MSINTKSVFTILLLLPSLSRHAVNVVRPTLISMSVAQLCFAHAIPSLPRPMRLALCRSPHLRSPARRRPRPRPTLHRTFASAVPDVLSSSEEDDSLVPIESFRVTADESGARLDKLLADRFNARSRTYIQTLFTSSCVTLDDTLTTTKSFRPSEGQLVTVRFLPVAKDLPLIPENLPLSVLHADEHLIIVNKPPDLVVHPAPGNWTGTLVHALCYHFPDIALLGGPRPGIVHRLDKGTSGVIAIARTSTAAFALSTLFAERRVRKDYVAITVGNPAGTGCLSRTLDAAIGRAPRDRTRMAVVSEHAGGRSAVSHVSIAASDDRGLLHAVRIRIDTGRTHQIRVHVAHAGAPVLGDETYGLLDVNRRFASAATRPMLHALRLRFMHPVTKKAIDVAAPLPRDMRDLMQRVVYPGFAEEDGW